MKCKLHPKYKAIRKPKNCQQCWSIYMNKHPNEKFPNLISGKEMSLNDWRKAGADAADNLIKNYLPWE